jgi:hypothetical protein
MYLRPAGVLSCVPDKKLFLIKAPRMGVVGTTPLLIATNALDLPREGASRNLERQRASSLPFKRYVRRLPLSLGERFLA